MNQISIITSTTSVQNVTAACGRETPYAITYLPDIFSAEPEQNTLDDIISDIKSSKYAKQIAQIDSEKNKDEQKKLKLQLPAFIPCMSMSIQI